MQRERRSHLILHVWDYFFISNVPRSGDERPWGFIERATERIRDLEADLEASKPSDVRLRAARRLRSAARTALRNIDELSAVPERWVTDGLEALEAFADALIAEVRDQAGQLVLD